MTATTPNLNGKICLITGATNGIGMETALALARIGATVVIAGRDSARTAATRAEIQNKSGNPTVHALVADLAALAEVRRLAREFRDRFNRLDVLVNNAGLIARERRLTADGYESTFAVNHLAPFLLTHELLDPLKASAPARVVIVASMAHQRGKIHFDDLNLERSWSAWKAYNQSKLANVMFTYELARRLRGTGVTANCLHPGVVGSNLSRGGDTVTALFFRAISFLLLTPEQGAQTSIYLGSAPEVEGVTGKYFSRKKPVQSSALSHDVAAQQRLWQVSCRMTDVPEDWGVGNRS